MSEAPHTATAGSAAPTPPAVARVLAALIGHSERWGKLWFGLLFWGSVLFAVARQVWPDSSDTVLGVASFAVGLAIGAIAHVRGKWL